MKVQCERCGEEIVVQIDLDHDLMLAPPGLAAVRHVVGKRCFHPITVIQLFDTNRVPGEVRVHGGILLDRTIPTG